MAGERRMLLREEAAIVFGCIAGALIVLLTLVCTIEMPN